MVLSLSPLLHSLPVCRGDYRALGLPALRVRGSVKHLHDVAFCLAAAIYFLANLVVILIAGVALWWYVESLRPVVDWIDPEGPGYRVLAQTPDYVEVRWIELRLLVDCPGRTEISVIGPNYASAIEAYPFVIDSQRRTFVRRYRLVPPLAPGDYEIRITDLARCSPLFQNRQILRVPFTVSSP